jgi:hypothetical protein
VKSNNHNYGKPVPGNLRVADFFGQSVGVGDQVAFMLGCGRRGRREMTQGYVLRVSPKTITVRYGSAWRAGSTAWYETVVRLDFVKVPPAFINPALVPDDAS